MSDARMSAAVLVSFMSVVLVLRAAPNAHGTAVEQQPSATSTPSQPAEWPPPDAVRPGKGVELPRLVQEVKPAYTARALQARIHGVVFLECVVGPDGRVDRVRITRSLDPTFGLDQEAIKAVRQWRFTPGTKDGKPVPVLVAIELTFSLRDTPREHQAGGGAVSPDDSRGGNKSTSVTNGPKKSAGFERRLEKLTSQLYHVVRGDERVGFVFWMPREWWQVAAEARSTELEEMESILKVLAPYTVVAAASGEVGPVGGVTWRGEQALAASAKAIDANGEEHSPLPASTVGADARNLGNLLKVLLAGSIGPVDDVHVFFFPGLMRNGKPVVDPMSEGVFAVRIDGETYEWDLPLSSLLPEKFCPDDNAPMDGSWNFCPWHGKELIPERPAVEDVRSTDRPAPLMRVEPRNRKTFAPADAVPAKTVFYLTVVRSENTRLGLYRCGEPCTTASPVATWPPQTIATGAELVSRVEVAGRYYLWGRNMADGEASTIISAEPRGNKLRVTFDTGAVVDVWYVTP